MHVYGFKLGMAACLALKWLLLEGKPLSAPHQDAKVGMAGNTLLSIVSYGAHSWQVFVTGILKHLSHLHIECILAAEARRLPQGGR